MDLLDSAEAAVTHPSRSMLMPPGPPRRISNPDLTIIEPHSLAVFQRQADSHDAARHYSSDEPTTGGAASARHWLRRRTKPNRHAGLQIDSEQQ